MSQYIKLSIDLFWVLISPLLALLIRDNFLFLTYRFEQITLYIISCFCTALIVFISVRLQNRIWRYTSLFDVMYVLAIVTAIILISLFVSFFFSRLDDVARSIPIIQWFLLTAGMVGSRVAVRLIGERVDRGRQSAMSSAKAQAYVLVVGSSEIAELYLRSVSTFARESISVVGVLVPGRELRGHLVRLQKVLGQPEDLQKVLDQLELHGVFVDRIVVTQPFEHFSQAAQQAIINVEGSSAISVEWLVESLGFRGKISSDVNPSIETHHANAVSDYLVRYGKVKRLIDVIVAMGLIVILAPLIILVGVLVAIDVGLPIVFWQQRPGRDARPFKLFKFRTMRAAHDRDGSRIPDEMRSSMLGRFLRKSRLDELPQLYNIVVGEMSFIGPRPLLPFDQPGEGKSRLLIRPGLTGWAQVNGGRDVSPEDKALLDIWYIANASLWLDLKILAQTLLTVLLGERVNGSALRDAHNAVQEEQYLRGSSAPSGETSRANVIATQNGERA